jgi:signal transduction histidine kinase
VRERAEALFDRRRDELIAAVAVVALVINVLTVKHTDRNPPVVPDVLVAIVFAGTLRWRRRAPLPATAVLMTAAIAQAAWLTAVDDTFVTVLILVLMMYSLGFHAEGREATIGIVFAAGTALVLSYTVDPGDVWFPVAFFFVMPWAGGRAMRNRLMLTRELAEKAARLEHQREERAAHAVADERARIARELHDVVAHSLTVMVIQAGAARRLVDRDPDRVVEVAGTIKHMGREALDEMRRLVGVMREAGEGPELAPQPTVADIEALVQRARDAGLHVELTVEGGRRDLPPGVDLSAYRVVQEALTNTIKHANASSASVAVRYGEGELFVAVTDDGSGSGSTVDVPSGGHGLTGMGERVSLYGGELEAGERAGGGFEVRARFPVQQEAYA